MVQQFASRIQDLKFVFKAVDFRYTCNDDLRYLLQHSWIQNLSLRYTKIMEQKYAILLQ